MKIEDFDNHLSYKECFLSLSQTVYRYRGNIVKDMKDMTFQDHWSWKVMESHGI